LPWAFYSGATATLGQKRDGLRRFADEIVSKLR
jgi:hypothetical protein